MLGLILAAWSLATASAQPVPETETETETETGAETETETEAEAEAEAEAEVESETPAAGPRRQNLAELLRRAERTSPGMRAARHAIDGAQARLSEATWSPYFQFTATGGIALVPGARGTPIFSPDDDFPIENEWGPAFRIAVEGAVPIWTFGKISSARDAARAGVEREEIDLDSTQAELRFNVRRAYFALQLALDTEQMISEGRGRLQRAVERIEQRIEAGDEDANEMDRWRLSSTLAEVEGRSSEAARLRESSVAALRILTGQREVHIPECPIERVEYEVRPVEWYVREALRRRPEARLIEVGLAAREASLDATRARFFPDIALALGASRSYTPGITDQHNPFVYDPANSSSLSAALVARWSMDLVGNEFRTRRARSELLETQALAEEGRRGIELDVTATYQELLDADRRERAWAVGHRDTRAWFVAAAQAYQVGTLEPRDLVDAVRAYFTARFNHLQAIRDFDTALAKLERGVGRELVPLDRWEPPCE